MATFYAGLDLGSSVCDLVVIDEAEQRVSASGFSTGERELIRQVREARRKLKGDFLLAVEEGEMSQWIADLLRPEVTRLIVCDPKRNAWIARDPSKSDRVDAHKLALLLKGGFLREIYHPVNQDRVEFKRVVQHYHDLSAAQASLKCRIKSLFRACGVLVTGEALFTADGRQKEIALLPGDTARRRVEQLYDVLDATQGAREKARRLMVSLGRAYPEVARFQQVPGIGPVWACTFSAYIQTPHRFQNKRKLWRFCRLGITDQKSNGESLHRRRLDSNGVGVLKALSFQVFCAAQRGQNEFSTFFLESLRRTQDKTHARLNTQRKILAVLYGMWKRDESYRPFAGRASHEDMISRA